VSELLIDRISVRDDITQRAADCAVEVKPSASVPPPEIEYSWFGDTMVLTGSPLRPNGGLITVNLGYAGIPEHVLFRGLIEFADDLTDANKNLFKFKLSAIPRNQPHRRKITKVFNSFFTDQADATTSRAIFENVCTAATLQIGRNDLPLYTVNGTWEVINQTPVQVAEQLLTPFNVFDYLKFYPRTDADGMQIIKIDYTQEPGGGVYDIPNIISVTNNWELYMPDSRVGDGKVLLTGADIFGAEQSAVARHVVFKTYESSTRDDLQFADFEKWSERRTKYRFIIDVYGGDLLGTDQLDDFIEALRAGSFTDLKIVESYALWDEAYDYDSVNGLIRSQHTYFTYEEKTFQDQLYMTNAVTQTVLTYDETQEYLYPSGTKFNKSMSRRSYNYNSIGIQTSVTTLEYFGFRQQWVLQDTRIDQGDTVAATNSEIQFYVNARKPLDSSPTQLSVGQSVVRSQKTQVGKYQLLDGSRLPVLASDLVNWAQDPNTNFALAEFERQSAYQLNCPGMDYSGLEQIWEIVQRQREIEHSNAYWQIITVQCSVDTAPAIGTSAKARGAYGFVTAINHDVDGNSALTEITLRRLHLNG